MWWRYLLINLIFGLLFLPLFYVLDAHRHILGYAAGLAIIAVDIAIMIAVARRIFLKKSIALTLAIIVFKYAVLGVFIYQGMDSEKYSNMGLLLGLSSFLPSLLIYVVKYPNLEVE